MRFADSRISNAASDPRSEIRTRNSDAGVPLWCARLYATLYAETNRAQPRRGLPFNHAGARGIEMRKQIFT
jgi:hypothetical protein